MKAKPQPRRFLAAHRGKLFKNRVFGIFGYCWADLMTRAEAEKEVKRTAGRATVLECLPAAPAKAKRKRSKRRKT